MKDLGDYCKVKSIISTKIGIKEKVIKNYPNILDIFNKIGKKNQKYIYAIFFFINNLC